MARTAVTSVFMRALGAGAGQSAVAAQQLPGVDVGGDHEQVERPRRASASRERTRRPRRPTPGASPAGRPSVDRAMRRRCPPARASAATCRRGARSGRRRTRIAAATSPTGARRSSATWSVREGDGRVDQPGPAAEVAQHRLDADPGPLGDVVEGDVGGQPLGVQVEGGLEDPPPGLLDGRGPGASWCRCVVVFMSVAVDIKYAFHVNDDSREMSGAVRSPAVGAARRAACWVELAAASPHICSTNLGSLTRACHSRQDPPHRRGQDPPPARGDLAGRQRDRGRLRRDERRRAPGHDRRVQGSAWRRARRSTTSCPRPSRPSARRPSGCSASGTSTSRSMGGAALHLGNIAEMKTGEGKTLVSTLPSYLNALSGKGVHVVTVNDYLAQVPRRVDGPGAPLPRPRRSA